MIGKYNLNKIEKLFIACLILGVVVSVTTNNQLLWLGVSCAWVLYFTQALISSYRKETTLPFGLDGAERIFGRGITVCFMMGVGLFSIILLGFRLYAELVR